MHAKHISIALFMTVSVAGWAGCSSQPTGGGLGEPGVMNNPQPTGGNDGGLLPTTGPGNGSQGAKQLFIDTVYPSLQGTCASCHATGAKSAPLYLSPAGADASYGVIEVHPGIIAIPDNSILLLHGPHTGPALLPAQKDLVTTWLTAEAKERNLVGGGGSAGAPTMTLAQALTEFGNCMSYTDWTTTGMNHLAQQETGGSGSCTGCHNQGEAGNYLNLLDDPGTFTKNRSYPYIKRLVTGTVDMNGGFKDLAPSNREIDKGAEGAICVPGPGIICHPPYTLPPTGQGSAKSVTDFVNKTLTNWRAKTCGGPTDAGPG